MTNSNQNLFTIIKFNEKGLVPAIAQDTTSKEVLMMAWMNKEALEKTLQTGLAHYFSRSRNKIWQKGESSKQIQEVTQIMIDCDGDSILLMVKQHGVACHTGRKNCFFNSIDKNGNIQINQKVLIPTKELYEKNN